MIKTASWATKLLVAGGVLYNSWPLGYWLNARVGITGFASELQATGQPYSWLFVWLDVASGALILAGIALLVRAYWRRMDWRLQIALALLVVFAVTTIAAALLPMSCVPTLRLCTALDQDPIYQAHGGVSVLSGTAIVLSVLVTAGKQHFRFWHGGLWVSLGLLVGLIGYAGLTAWLHLQANTLQYAFILYCGAWVAVFPFVVRHVPKKAQAAKRSNQTQQSKRSHRSAGVQ